MTCTWHAGDSFHQACLSYASYDSWSAALAASSGFDIPDLVWGSLPAYCSHDGSAPFVDVSFSIVGFIKYNWQIGIFGNGNAASGFGFNSLQEALAAAQASPLLPAGFCLESDIVCDPKELTEASKCYCLPKNVTLAVWIYLLCQWANKP